MKSPLKKYVAKHGVDAKSYHLQMAVLNALPSDLVVDELVEGFKKALNDGTDPDLTPEEREWMVAFYGSTAFSELLKEMADAFGIEQMMDKIVNVEMSESDVSYLKMVIDEDPEYVATVYANEVADLYLR